MRQGRRQTTDTVPKLDRIEYLFDTLVAVSEEATLDEIRLSLIRVRQDVDRKSRRDLRAEQRPQVRRLENPRADTFWANARESIRELMKLGMVRRKPVPNTSAEFLMLRGDVFEITPEGQQFVSLGDTDAWQFRDRFFCAMHAAHPYIQSLALRLWRDELFIPKVPSKEIPDDVEAWRRRPPEMLQPLVDSIARALSHANGQNADKQRLHDFLKMNLEKTALVATTTVGDKQRKSRAG